MSRMGLRAYARHRKELGLVGGSLNAVQKAVTTGRIRKGDDGLIDAEAADVAWAANSDPSKRRQDGPVKPPEPPPEPPILTGEVLPAPSTLTRRPQFWGPDWPETPPPPENPPPAAVGDRVVDGDVFQEWRTRLVRAQALREEAKQLEDEGTLLRAEDARRTWLAIGKMYGQARQNMPAQLAPQLVGLKDVREIERRIRTYMVDQDTRLADEIEAQFGEVAHGSGAERCGAGQ